MTRFFLATIVIFALISVGVTQAATFKDVAKNHWAYDAIQKAVDAGIVSKDSVNFNGNQNLNRYQMAKIVAKLLGAVAKSGTGTAAGTSPEMLRNLEALTIEFADELALLNVRVLTLDDAITELSENGVSSTKQTVRKSPLTAHMSFALLHTDSQDNLSSTLTRYGNADTDLFTLSRICIGYKQKISEGVTAILGVGVQSHVGGSQGKACISCAAIKFDELFANVGGKIGAFQLPFSMEHNAPFFNCNYTITPSVANSYIMNWRTYGIELTEAAGGKKGDISWKFGIMSGTGGEKWSFANPGWFLFNDKPLPVNWGGNGSELDDSFGYYLHIAQKPKKEGKIGWNVSYFDNGGDRNATAPHTASPETDFYNIGLEWAKDNLLVLCQFLDGQTTPVVGTEVSFTTWYILLNYKLNKLNSITARYDFWEFGQGGPGNEGTGYTFAFIRELSKKTRLQIEWLSPDEDGSALFPDQNDDLIQVRYRINL